MSLKALRDFVVVSKDDAPKQTASGLFIAPSAEEKVVSGVVVDVGSGLISDRGTSVPLEVKVGDKVVFNKSLAVEVKNEDKTFYVLREEHILCVVA
jgi:chaperonin GroES